MEGTLINIKTKHSLLLESDGSLIAWLYLEAPLQSDGPHIDGTW
jgi:hypothetical protein